MISALSEPEVPICRAMLFRPIQTEGDSLESQRWVIDHLNTILTIEPTAVNRYLVQAGLCKNWEFNRLYQNFRPTNLKEATTFIKDQCGNRPHQPGHADFCS